MLPTWGPHAHSQWTHPEIFEANEEKQNCQPEFAVLERKLTELVGENLQGQ